MKKLITQACSILPALVLVSCSSLSIEDVQVYKGQTDPAIVNKGLHKLMDYTKNPVENPVVFAYALEVGADLVHNQRQGIDPKINRDNELISNRFGQHIILTEVALRKDREKLLENGYTPKTAESMVKPWTLYSLSKMDREKYFYTYWQHLGEEPYLYDLNVQYAAMQGLGAKRDDFVRNNAMAIMLLQKTSRALVAVGEKHQNLADYLIEKALRLRTLNYVLNELYNKDKYEVEDKDQQLNILVQWVAKYIHYKIEHKQFVKSEQQDLQDSFHILAKIATNRSLPIASKSAYDQLLDWGPTVLRHYSALQADKDKDVEFLRTCLGLTPWTRDIETMASLNKQLYLEVNFEGAKHYLLNPNIIMGAKFVQEGNQAVIDAVNGAMGKYLLPLSVDDKEWFYDKITRLYPREAYNYLMTVKWPVIKDDLVALQALRYMYRLSIQDEFNDKEKENIRVLMKDIIPNSILRNQSELIFAAIDGHLDAQLAILQYEGCVAALKEDGFESKGNYHHLMRLYASALKDLKKNDPEAFEQMAPEAAQNLALLIREHRDDCVALLAAVAEICVESNMLEAILDHGFHDPDKVLDSELVLIRELARKSRDSSPELREKLFDVLSSQIPAESPDLSLLAVSLLIELYQEDEAYSEKLVAAIEGRWPELLGEEE